MTSKTDDELYDIYARAYESATEDQLRAVDWDRHAVAKRAVYEAGRTDALRGSDQ